MRITTKLQTISIAMIAALVMLLPAVFWSFSSSTSARKDFDLVDRIQVNFLERSSLSDQYFLYREELTRIRWDESKQKSNRLLLQAKLQFQGEDDRQIVTELIRDIDDTAVIFYRITANSRVLKTAAGNREILEELDKRLSSQLLLKATSIRDAVSALKDSTARRVGRTYQLLAVMVILLAGMLALGTLVYSVNLLRLLRVRLASLHLGTKIIGGGRLDYRLNVQGADEFTELAQSINAMTGTLESEISSRMRSEEKVLELNRDFLILLENTTDFIYFKDENDCFRFCSQTLADLAGYASWRDMVGKHDRALFPDGPASFCSGGLSAFSDARPILNMTDTFLDAQGRKGWINTNKWPVFDGQNRVTGIFGISHDISERIKADEQLREYAQRLIQQEEDLRKTIATELHDDVGQELTALSLNLAYLGKYLGGENRIDLRPTLDDSRVLAREINRTVRNLMNTLRPTQLEEYGLESAIRSHVELYAQRSGIAVIVHASPDFPRLSSEKEIALFRIAQEALNNIVKHAAATKVTVTLECAASSVLLLVTDDGKGLLPGCLILPKGTGYGLTIMRERAELVGGRFRIDAAPGAGTSVVVQIGGGNNGD